MADTAKTKNKSLGSTRAKAGRRRPPHLQSVKDRNGHRDWVTVSHAVPKSVSWKPKKETTE